MDGRDWRQFPLARHKNTGSPYWVVRYFYVGAGQCIEDFGPDAEAEAWKPLDPGIFLPAYSIEITIMTISTTPRMDNMLMLFPFPYQANA